MAKQIQLRRGTTTEHNIFTGAVGELTYDTEKKQLRVHDGSTVGGKVVDDPTRNVTSQVSNATETEAGKAKIATTAIAQVGTNDTDIITALKLKNTVFGLGQTRKSITIVSGTKYTNTSGKTKLISIYLVNGSDYATLKIGDITTPNIGASQTGGGGMYITFAVLPSEEYTFTYGLTFSASEIS